MPHTMLDPLLKAMREKGLESEALKAFENFWNSHEGNVNDVPCPFCHASGNTGKLIALPKDADDDWVRCQRCRAEVHIPA